MLERLEEADRKKAAERKSKKKSSKQGKASSSCDPDDVSCEQCGHQYNESEVDSWIGCDACDTWWHYWCAGLPSMLTEEDEWLCAHCL